MYYAMSDAERKVKTHMKLVTRRLKPEELLTPPQHENDTLKVVGVHIVGDNADEMLQGYVRVCYCGVLVSLPFPFV
jgi:pyruvate/2-oxoglutarate dehydrogenase complex dihydrolipoamide dehydrogenase (E3) component